MSLVTMFGITRHFSIRPILMKHTYFNILLTKRYSQKAPASAPNPLTLEPIKKTSRTLRAHDNTQRQRLYEFGMYVAACMPKYVQLVQMQFQDDLEICIHPDGLIPVLSFMRNHQHACFESCSAMTAVDVPARENRFEVVYCLLSMRFVAKARIKTYCDELTPLESAYCLYYAMYAFEREVYDMFGVVFLHHPDLRRILTDYGFQGHPLRKDYPLMGYVELRYDDEQKRLVWDPIEMTTEMRVYSIQSPWDYYNAFHEGYHTPLPPPPPPKKCK